MRRIVRLIRIAKYLLLLLVTAWGAMAIFLMASNVEGSDLRFMQVKLAGVVNLGLCVIAGKWFNRQGWLPDTIQVEDPEHEEWEEEADYYDNY